VSSYRHTPKYRRPEKCGNIVVNAIARVVEGRDDGLVDPLSYYSRGDRGEHTIRALHEPYSMVICRCDAPTFGIEHRRLGVTGSSKPSVIRHLSNMRRDFLSPPTAIRLAAAP